MRAILKTIRLEIKNLLFPGLDFCLRQRLKLVKKYLRAGDIKTLDVGCGNGALSFLCYSLGNSVTGIDINADNIDRCRKFAEFKRFPDKLVKFKALNAYNLSELNGTFDQILCFEVLEHLLRDKLIIELFTKLLNPQGILHLGVPNLNCPDYYGERISTYEDGSHVRKGYSYPMIKKILEGYNLAVVKKYGYGGIFTLKVTVLSRRIGLFLKTLPPHIREAINVFLFLIVYPFTYLDKFSRGEPMSLYIMARK